jgi:hypothetical protein
MTCGEFDSKILVLSNLDLINNGLFLKPQYVHLSWICKIKGMVPLLKALAEFVTGTIMMVLYDLRQYKPQSKKSCMLQCGCF